MGRKRKVIDSANPTPAELQAIRKALKRKEAVAEGPAVNVPEIVSKLSILFETSWEVCNKVGGIYTVLSTKAKVLHEQFDDRLVFIGPDVWSKENPSPYFKERKLLFRSAGTRMQLPWGIKIRTGKWDIPGSPLVILVNPGETYRHIQDVYAEMWENYGVDSLHSYGDYEEGCCFAVAAAIVQRALVDYLAIDRTRVISHFNEWTTGMGLLYTKLHSSEFATIFTTHATSIGRSICGNGKPLYDFFEGYFGDQMAKELNMESKHSLEKIAAHQADCFTTVSEITARECEQLLDIRPQVVTPNGFEPHFVPKTIKYNRNRVNGRERLLKIANAITGKNYDDNTLLIATAGRHEYRNKGLDLFIDAMDRLERMLPTDDKALAFVLVPGWVKSPDYKLQDIVENGASVRPELEYVTHLLNNTDSDEIVQRIGAIRNSRFFRQLDIIYIPSYLDGNDGIVNISYYDLLAAFDVTIFPSYYEPWGYTPLESMAFGVPTITTDKSGFGMWALQNGKNGLMKYGVEVVKRSDSNYSEACKLIAEAVLDFDLSSDAERIYAHNQAFVLSNKADWQFFIKYYDQAFQLALESAKKRIKENGDLLYTHKTF